MFTVPWPKLITLYHMLKKCSDEEEVEGVRCLQVNSVCCSTCTYCLSFVQNLSLAEKHAYFVSLDGSIAVEVRGIK